MLRDVWALAVETSPERRSARRCRPPPATARSPPPARARGRCARIGPLSRDCIPNVPTDDVRSKMFHGRHGVCVCRDLCGTAAWGQCDCRRGQDSWGPSNDVWVLSWRYVGLIICHPTVEHLSQCRFESERSVLFCRFVAPKVSLRRRCHRLRRRRHRLPSVLRIAM